MCSLQRRKNEEDEEEDREDDLSLSCPSPTYYWSLAHTCVTTAYRQTTANPLHSTQPNLLFRSLGKWDDAAGGRVGCRIASNLGDFCFPRLWIAGPQYPVALERQATGEPLEAVYLIPIASGAFASFGYAVVEGA